VEIGPGVESVGLKGLLSGLVPPGAIPRRDPPKQRAMLSAFDTRPGHSRREFLRIGTLGLSGLSLPQLLGARALAAGNKSITTDKSVIFLFLFCGPSQFETFDPKMSALDGVRCVNGEIAAALPGVTFGSMFPQLAKRANQLAVVRSYVPGREISNHLVYPIVHPKETLGASLGSVYSRMVGMTHPINGMPTNAALFPQAVDARFHSSPNLVPSVTLVTPLPSRRQR
jgi:hypothetical protein